ncbi:MAG: hypothetical protein ABIK12_10015, partial [Pseudomonadota bacterium]
MLRRPTILLLLAVALCLAGPLTALAESQVFIHYIVVPIPSQDGTTDEIAAFRAKLIELAGGYTEMGLVNGGSRHDDGQIETARNFAYLVSASRNITADLEEYVPRHFPTSKPFVLVW